MNVLNRIFSRILAMLSREKAESTAIIKYPPKEQQETRNREIDDKDTIKVASARIVSMPFQPYGRRDDKQCNYSQEYWTAYNQGYSYYNRGWYSNAKEILLTIYNENHSSGAYYTHLLRTYRKLYSKYVEKKKYKEALLEMEEMFSKCPNTTTTDIKSYNKIIDILKEEDSTARLSKKEIVKDTKPDCIIESQFISLVQTEKKPKGFKLSQPSGEDILRLQNRSHLLPTNLPHINFSRGSIEYLSASSIPSISDDLYRFNEAPDRSCFVSATRDLSIKLYNWDLILQKSFDARAYCNAHYSLRDLSISPDLSLVAFVSESRAFVLDSNFRVISRLGTLPKEGWKRISKNKPNVEEIFSRHLQILGITQSNPTTDEIKSAYRRLAFVYHPDKNPDGPKAAERFREITAAYEVLTNEDARRAFAGLDDEEEWIQVLDTLKFEAGGVTFSVEISLGGDGRDWIYALGFAPDSKRLYLGCYSGRVYRASLDGCVDIIYTIPEDKESIYGAGNPIVMIFHDNECLYIVTHWYLYILRGDDVVACIHRQKGTYKWFKGGFLFYQGNALNVLSPNGESFGTIQFKNNIRNIASTDDLLLVETGLKSFLFKMHKIVTQ